MLLLGMSWHFLPHSLERLSHTWDYSKGKAIASLCTSDLPLQNVTDVWLAKAYALHASNIPEKMKTKLSDNSYFEAANFFSRFAFSFAKSSPA